MKAGFWKSDWFLGIALTLAMLIVSGSAPLRNLDRQAYDFGLRLSERTPSDRIVVIAIDDASLAEFGPWPWSRELPARLIDILAAAPAQVIGSALPLAEAQRDPGAVYLERLAGIVERAVRDGMLLPPARGEVAAVLAEADSVLQGDRRLAASLAHAGNVVLPLQFSLGGAVAAAEPPPEVAAGQLARVSEGDGRIPSASGLRAPFAPLTSRVLAFGHVNHVADSDGRVRSDLLAVRYGELLYPSLALSLAAASRGVAPGEIRGRGGDSLRVAGLRLPVDGTMRLHPFFYRGAKDGPAFPVVSFADAVNGRLPAADYAGKIVLIGATAASEAPLATPRGPMAPVLVVAHTLSSLLQGDSIVVPAWGGWVAGAALLLVGLYLAAALPALGAGAGLLATLLLQAILLGAPLGLLLGAGLWLPLTGAACLLPLGHLAWAVKRCLAGGGQPASSGADTAEANRLQALALQGQGLLDQAFAKFCLCPVNAILLDDLYSLGLDCERRRDFAQAAVVYRWIAGHDPAFRDIASRLRRGAGTGAPAALPQRTAIGRYQLEKALGKGAMGIVYRGRDGQTGRTVAIKTMALAQEFDADELADVKQRFFREAETVGRLDHPNIVALYEAGEEQDLAYIAMEFLPGGDLVPWCRPETRLPLATVLSIGIRVADALDYAHGRQVVHRDVKPANIMYAVDGDQLKVTDFGIARITDASRTRTGMVLGTPSYMSPEQLAGKKIDGRSDIYSLGVTLYQLCCGQLPFSGASLAQLMYKIANEPAPDICGIEPALPPEVAAVIAKAMAKDIGQRYQRAADLAADLRRCLERLGGEGG